MLSSLLLLGCALNVNAASLSFRRTELSAAAKDLISRNTRIARASSRISREPHLRLEGRDHPEPIQAEFTDDYYTSEITLGGKSYKVVLNTCSPDIWVDSAPTHNYHQTTYHTAINYNLSTGALEVDGTVGWAPLEFGTYKLEKQAFLNIHDDAGKLYEQVGFNGFFGIGLEFATGSSKVEEAVYKHEGANSAHGKTVLSNYFSVYPEVDKVVGINFQRSEDWSGIDGVDISLGEYPEEWMGIKESESIDLYPEDSPKWTAIIHGVAVEGGPINVQSKIEGVEDGSLVAHFTATGPTVLPRDLFDQVYGSISGAVGYTGPDGEKRWIVPCLSDYAVQIQIGERTFTIHPSDVTQFWENKPEVLKDYTVCISSFRGKDMEEPLYDLQLGSAFARNVYSIYGFPLSGDDGSIMESAYLLLKPKEDDMDIDDIRGPLLQQYPKELSPEETVKKLNEGEYTPPHSTTKHHGPTHTWGHHNPTNTHGHHSSSTKDVWHHSSKEYGHPTKSSSTHEWHGHPTKSSSTHNWHQPTHSSSTHNWHGHPTKSSSTHNWHHPTHSSSTHNWHGHSSSTHNWHGHSSSTQDYWPGHPTHTSSSQWHHGGHSSSSQWHHGGHSSSSHNWHHPTHSSSTEDYWNGDPTYSSSTDDYWNGDPTSSSYHHGHHPTHTSSPHHGGHSSSTHQWHGDPTPSSSHHGHHTWSSSTSENWAHPTSSSPAHGGHHTPAVQHTPSHSSSSEAEPTATKSGSDGRSGSRGSANREGDDDTVTGGAVAGDSTSSGTLDKFMPIILGLLGANILVGLILIGLAVMNYVKKNGSGKKTGSHVYVPVSKLGDA
ncbi:acid protease [Coprinopsis marcescibilis]|uniref:Acid protease n=1 Tax=Coprinopsis marcescibilis TaxID=230819 RepID=A0A5C3KVP8_COPMA|nr:acid protease [Coprinopsis marcescibilis]